MTAPGYVAPWRLVSTGQRYQGDIVVGAPFLVPTPNGEAAVETRLAILLTPTCDYALKTGGDTRNMCAIDVFAADSPLRQQFAQNVVPHHVCPLPPLDSILPHGGAVLFRHSSPIQAVQLERLTRATMLDEDGLRALLVSHTRYYLRTLIDGVQIKIPADDPRPLWSALDAAVGERQAIRRRDAVLNALEVGIAAMAQHHGVAAPGVAIGLHRLRVLANRAVVSPLALAAIRTLVETEEALKGIYERPPHDSAALQPILIRLLGDLESVGVALQERDPVQFSEARYRALVQENDPRV